MSPGNPLDRLAAAHRIESDYIDIWGQRQTIGENSKRALLAAMGVAADSDTEIDASLEAARQEAFSRLAPVGLVITDGEPLKVPVTTNAVASGRIAWRFVTESGEQMEGDAVLSALDVSEATASRIRRPLPLPLRPAPGYHRLTLTFDDRETAETEIIVTPKRAFWPSCLDRHGGVAGLTAPLYGLRSGRNAGIGDFTDLAVLATKTAPMGADFIGINPVHALFPAEPGRISPYSPSSRLFLNTLLIALDQVPELMPSEAARQLLNDSDTLQRLRASDLVDYPAVADFKLQVLEALFKAFLAGPPTAPTRVAFERFRKASGDALERHARFEAIGDFLATSGSPRTAWQDWPEALRSPTSPEVQAFAAQHDERVTFFAWLQWLADHQLERAQSTATAAGGALGLYLDLAVGAAPDGAEAWSDQDVLIADVRIGAPPDDFNPAGQDWGLLPLSPTTLQARAYRPFIQLLRRNMRHAGALRIDHVLGLARSFWQPADKSAPGAYIRYPMEDLLGIVALESWRQRCVVIGEDLGTVPRELRSALDRRGLLGCRLLYFEREDDGTFKPAANYPKASITSTGTHDLPTLSGFWEGRDIKVREDLGLITNPEQARSERATRQATRQALLKLLADEALLPPNVSPEDPPETLTWQLVLAFHTFLGRTPATLRIVQLEDAVGARDQANLPGTVDEYPNWRRKVGHDLEHLTLDERLSLLLKAVSRANPPRAERTGEPRHNESGDDT